MPVRQGRIFSPASLQEISWSRKERESEIARRDLRTTEEASFHLIRLRTAEAPHTHDSHDLVVFVIKGKVRVVLGGRQMEIRSGDVLEIPRGTVHEVENLDPEAAEVYAVFTPPFDGQDHRPAAVTGAAK